MSINLVKPRDWIQTGLVTRINATNKNSLRQHCGSKRSKARLGIFHLASKSATEIKKIIAEFKRLGVTHVGPCHCTGEKAIKQFKTAYKNGFIPVGAGSVINI